MRRIRFMILLLSANLCVTGNTYAAILDQDESRQTTHSAISGDTKASNSETRFLSKHMPENNLNAVIVAILMLTQITTLILYRCERLKRKRIEMQPNKENELQIRNKTLSTSIHEHLKKEDRSQEIQKSQIEIIRKLTHIVYLYSHDSRLFYKNFKEFMETEISCRRTLDEISWVANEAGGGVIERLKSEYPELTSGELRFCSLVFIGFTNQEICSIAGYNALNTVYVKKHRIKSKLGIEPGKNLKHFLTEFAAGNGSDKQAITVEREEATVAGRDEPTNDRTNQSPSSVK